MIDLTASNDDDATLPLVLITIGGDEGEFEALHRHLEAIENDPEPPYQSLVVARPNVPKMVYKVIRARIKPLRHVHLLKLGSDAEGCRTMKHESGTFYATPLRRRKQRN